DTIATRLEDGRVELRWKEPVTARLYSGAHPDTIDRTHPLAEVTEQDHLILNPPAASHRHYFCVVYADGREDLVAERFIHVGGTVNLRDIGGYRTTDGYMVRWGRVFRSGTLTGLMQTDTSVLDELGLKIVCDLRSVEEVAEAPDRLPQNPPPRYIPLPLDTDSAESNRARMRAILFDKKRLGTLMREMYAQLMIDRNAKLFGDVLRLLADEDNLPALYHCTAGKDRTGITTALLLLALGVPEDMVLADYTLSNHYHENFRLVAEKMIRPIRWLRVSVDDLSPLLVADAAVMKATIEHLHANYGTVEAYLLGAAGLTEDELAALKTNLLATVPSV
ncbi:MAG: tyrosine-protein phosphatase, partial [bacterium]|nr:tyrosine-protein phosphatase [bacterium]